MVCRDTSLSSVDSRWLVGILCLVWCPGCGCVVCQDTSLSSVDSWVSVGALPHPGVDVWSQDTSLWTPGCQLEPCLIVVSRVWMCGLSGHLTVDSWVSVGALPHCGVPGVDAWSVRTPHCGLLGVSWSPASLRCPGCEVGALPHCGVLGVNGLSGHLTELCGLRVSCWSPVPQFGVLGVNMWSFKTLH